MRDRFPIIFTLVLLLMVYWQWFLPGPRVANDFSFISHSTLKSYLDFPRIWSEFGAEGLGEYTVFTLWSWPLNFILGFFANLGIDFNLLERIFFIIPILSLGAVGIWRLCQSIKLSNSASAISIIFFLTNTYILLLIDGGQLSIALAYSFLPICFLSIQKALHGGLKSKIISGLTVATLGFFDIRFIFIVFLLSFIYFVYERISWVKGLNTGFVAGLVVIGIHAYWLLPFYQVPITSETYQQLINTSPGGFTNIGHALSMLSPNWFKNVFGSTTQLKWEFVFIPLLVFLAPILRPKSKVVGFWLIVALMAIFLTKGTNPPLTNIYSWLFTNIPGFSLFRDSTKFFFLVALSYSILIGITVDEISKRIRPAAKWVYFLVILYLVILVRPAWQGIMTGTFSPPLMHQDYQSLGEILQKDEQFSRIFWIPSVPPLGYSEPNHPWVEAARLYKMRPLAVAVKGNYELFNFLREGSYVGQIFDVLGIGYVGYPYLDSRRDNLHPDNIRYYYTFSDQLSKLPWLSKVDSSAVPVWQVNTHQDKFFITANTWWVIGSDDIYGESTKSAKLALSKNSLIFAEERAGLGKEIEKLTDAKIVLNKKNDIDLAASFIEPDDLIFPAKQLRHDPDISGWWKRDTKDLINFKDFLKLKYGINNQDFDLGGGWAVGEGRLKFKVKSEKLKGKHILLARVLESTRSGELKFYQDNQLIGNINTKKEGNNVRWFEVGEMGKDGSLTIESDGDINVVNALAILDKQEWLGFHKKADSLRDRIIDFSEDNTHETDTVVTYQQINPTKYKVYIQNLTEPTFLIFSQTFDKNWNMSGQRSLPVYSLLNGFRVETDGEYLVEFEVQKYVYPGLMISSLTFLTALFLLISFHPKAKS